MAEEEGKALPWPKGAEKVEKISEFEFLMCGNDDEPILKIEKEKLNEFIVINGEAVKAVAGGATSSAPTILRPGPTGQNRKMEKVKGWFVNGTSDEPPVATGTPWEAPEDFDNTNWWDGTAKAWSLGSSIPMPRQDVVDNLTTESSSDALSANQGRNLQLKKLDIESLPNELFEKVGALADDDDNSFVLTDFKGNVAFEVKSDGSVSYNGQFSEERIPSEFENRGLIAMDDEKFAISDNNGNVIFLAEAGKVDFIGKSLDQNQSSLNKIASLDNSTLTIIDFTRHSKKGIILSAYCDLLDLSTGSITVGFGKLTYRGRYIDITPTAVVPKRFETSEIVGTSIPHNLAIESFLSISLYVDDSGKGMLILTSKNGNSKLTLDWGYETNYDPFIMSTDVALSNVKMNLTNKDFKKPIWVFTDSYGGIATNRWPGVMKGFGFFSFYLNGLAGQSSQGALNDFKKSLRFGTPKYLVWCLGMNDSDANYQAALNELKEICSLKNIQLILSTIPTVPTRNKEVISQTVRDSGYRYIDFYKSVGADSSGNWYTGMLHSDGVHPTDLGAKALASQVLVDFPEMMKEGIVSTSSEIGEISGDN